MREAWPGVSACYTKKWQAPGRQYAYELYPDTIGKINDTKWHFVGLFSELVVTAEVKLFLWLR
jgi:hypothetical protein